MGLAAQPQTGCLDARECAPGPQGRPAFGRCPHPAGTTTRPDRRRRQVVRPRPRRRRAGTARGRTQRPGALQPDPGSAGWSPGDGWGGPPSAPRHPAGEGAGAPTASRSATGGNRTDGEVRLPWLPMPAGVQSRHRANRQQRSDDDDGR
jgi:hypothetical protein